jgi:hypothetical protein
MWAGPLPSHKRFIEKLIPVARQPNIRGDGSGSFEFLRHVKQV